MLGKIKHTVVTVLATLGVLFIILLLLPDDEEEVQINENEQQVQTIQENEQEKPDALKEENQDSKEGSTLNEPIPEGIDAAVNNEAGERQGNIAEVHIPDSELSDEPINFRTVTLEGDREDTLSIFSDYDITIVHVWGTYCASCITEMTEYADLYNEIPDNVNLIGIVCDAYDGIENNVREAEDILEDTGTEFLNIRISDSVYNVTARLQFVPASFFVDKDGRIIGDVIEGAECDEIKERLMGYME